MLFMIVQYDFTQYFSEHVLFILNAGLRTKNHVKQRTQIIFRAANL